MLIGPLTIATFLPALLTVLALPFGFVEVAVAEIAGFYDPVRGVLAAVDGALVPLRPASDRGRSHRRRAPIARAVAERIRATFGSELVG